MATEQAADTKPANTSNGQSARPTREALLAGLDQLASNAEQGGKVEIKTPPANENEPAKDPPKEPEPKEPEPEEDPDDDGADDKEPDQAAAKDPDLQKRLAIVAKQEKRARDREDKVKAEIGGQLAALKRERESFEREVSQAKTQIESFNKLKARARYDAAGVLKELGLGEEDLGAAARHLWAQSKEGAADPKVSKEAAARLMKERENEDRISKLERELREERESKTKAQSEAQLQRQVESYLDGITKAATEDHPLAQRLIAKSPEKARIKFAEIAIQLGERDGDEPDAEDVLAAYEKVRRAELEDDGVDVASMLKSKPKAKDDGAKTIGNDVGSRTAPKAAASKKTHEQKKAELEAELRAMDAKGR